jgi:DNA repair protein RecO (recombination protein O)
MFQTTKGLILREVRYKEADRILTVLTESEGKITAKARGALRKSSRSAAATQQLTWSELTLFGNRGKWTVNEGSVIEGFDGLREDIASLALGSYFSECLDALSAEEEPDPALLQLGLNSLYALSRRLYDPLQIKAAFELRLMKLTGFQPNVDACVYCGNTEPEDPCLGIETGGLCCRACRRADFGLTAGLDRESLAALRYVIAAPARQLFSFKLEGKGLRLLSDAAEAYLREHAERGFATLDYWKKIQ